MQEYLFTSNRLGFRNWSINDLDAISVINSNQQVMEFFPSIQNREQTNDFIERMQQHFESTGFCYFAIDHLEQQECIGFIGLCLQTFLPKKGNFVDIGWRLSPNYWNQGLATEGARACLKYGFEELNLQEIYSIAPAANEKSQKIMQKIGMNLIETFDHPKLMDNDRLRTCVLYRIDTALFEMETTI